MKVGVSQWNKPTPDKVKVWAEALSYVLVGLGGFSFVADHQNLAYGLTLTAGAIDKFVPRLFGY